MDTDGEFAMVRGTGSLHLDITLLPLLTPYAGGGIGPPTSMAIPRCSMGSRSKSRTTLTLQRMARSGSPWTFCRRSRSSPAYRDVWINSGDGDTDDITAHVVKLGARLEF